MPRPSLVSIHGRMQFAPTRHAPQALTAPRLAPPVSATARRAPRTQWPNPAITFTFLCWARAGIQYRVAEHAHGLGTQQEPEQQQQQQEHGSTITGEEDVSDSHTPRSDDHGSCAVHVHPNVWSGGLHGSGVLSHKLAQCRDGSAWLFHPTNQLPGRTTGQALSDWPSA